MKKTQNQNGKKGKVDFSNNALALVASIQEASI